MGVKVAADGIRIIEMIEEIQALQHVRLLDEAAAQQPDIMEFGYQKFGPSETYAPVLPAVKADIDCFVGTAPQFDDITMLCLEYKARMEEPKTIQQSNEREEQGDEKI